MATSNPDKLTLTDMMQYIRIGLVVGGICIVGAIFFNIMMSMTASLQTAGQLHDADVAPTTVLQPTYAFGRLPAIVFPRQTDARPTSFTAMMEDVQVNNASSGWPIFGDRRMIEVYQLQPLSYSLSADQKARNIARNLEFYAEPSIVDERTYLFRYPGPPLVENLQIDLKTMFMYLTTDYQSVPNLFGTTTVNGVHQIPDNTSAIKAVRNYLSTAGVLPKDLSDAAAVVNYVTNVGTSLQPSQGVIDADFVTVSLPRQGLEGLRDGEPTTYNFYGPNNYTSVYAVVGRDLDGQDVVVELEDVYYDLNTDRVGTYVLKPASQAWEELTSGGGYVVNPRGVSNAMIRSVELGYYESHEEQDYLLPIYVFKGDNGVIAYVQGLDSNQLSF
ncbi:hypothetical protein IJJ12_00615 [bacterium]|nr:hypothetical protein [bacterium]